MKTRESFETERLPLQPPSKHHFNWKHLLGVVNWHLPRRGLHKHSFINLSPLSHAPSSSVSLSRLPLHSHFLVSFHFSLSSPTPPQTPPHPPLSVPLLRTTPPTPMNASASFFPLQLRQHLLKDPWGGWGGEFLFLQCTLLQEGRECEVRREEVRDEWGQSD